MKNDGKVPRSVRCEKRIAIPPEKIRMHYLMYATETDERTVYDLEIRVIDPSGWDECTLYDIATSEKMALRIWRMFTDGTVMPITAQDILEELLSDAAFLYDDEMIVKR